jgi:hypothetical protein
LKKRKVLVRALLYIFFGGLGYLVCPYSGLFSYNAFAQSGANTEENVVVKIPPMIKIPEDNTNILPPILQISDIRILTSEGKSLVFRVELAQTENQKRTGLMFRSTIAPGTGMLFLFSDVQEREFWMKNTWVPLDIIFIREDGVIHNIHHSAEPHSLERINSGGLVQHVLEIAGGEANRLGVSIGDRILFD